MDINATEEVWKFFKLYADEISGVKEENTISNELILFPNPVTKRLSINSSETIISAAIIDLSGKQVKGFSGNQQNNLQLDFSKVSKGIYILISQTKKGRMYNKIVVQGN